VKFANLSLLLICVEQHVFNDISQSDIALFIWTRPFMTHIAAKLLRPAWIIC